MLSALRAAVTDPGSFFERELEDPSLREPAIVVAVVAIVGLVSSVPVFQGVAGAVPDEAAPFVLVGLAIGALAGLVGPFVVGWCTPPCSTDCRRFSTARVRSGTCSL